MPMDVYLDNAGIPRKTTTQLDGQGFNFHFTYELYDVGQPVEIPQPPAAQNILTVQSVQALFQLLV